MADMTAMAAMVIHKLSTKLHKAFPNTSFYVDWWYEAEREFIIEWNDGPSGVEVEAVTGKQYYGLGLFQMHTVYCKSCGNEALAMPDRPICFPCSKGEIPPPREDKDWF